MQLNFAVNKVAERCTQIGFIVYLDLIVTNAIVWHRWEVSSIVEGESETRLFKYEIVKFAVLGKPDF